MRFLSTVLASITCWSCFCFIKSSIYVFCAIICGVFLTHTHCIISSNVWNLYSGLKSFWIINRTILIQIFSAVFDLGRKVERFLLLFSRFNTLNLFFLYRKQRFIILFEQRWWRVIFWKIHRLNIKMKRGETFSRILRDFVVLRISLCFTRTKVAPPCLYDHHIALFVQDNNVYQDVANFWDLYQFSWSALR